MTGCPAASLEPPLTKSGKVRAVTDVFLHLSEVVDQSQQTGLYWEGGS